MDARILVVDDDRVSCELMRDVLHQATGTPVLAFTDGRAAAGLIAREKFSVMLLDYQMPSPDGIELTRLARRAGMNQMTPIILVSDDQSTSAISNGFAAGAQFFLYKPVDKTRLLRLIRAMHGSMEQERRRFRRVALRARVRLQYESTEFEGETLDVSLDGMLVHTAARIPRMAVVRVSLYQQRSGNLPITGSGQVVRVLEQDCLGIHLNRLAPTESSRMQELLLPMILNEDRLMPRDALTPA